MPKRVRFLLPGDGPQKEKSVKKKELPAETPPKKLRQKRVPRTKELTKDIYQEQIFRFDGMQLFAELFLLPTKTRREYLLAIAATNENRRREGKLPK